MRRLIPLILTLLFLGGCNYNTASTTKDVGPQTAWKEVAKKKMDSAARIAEARAKEAQALADLKEINARTEPAPQIVIDSAAELETYAAMKRDEIMLQVIKASNENARILAESLNQKPAPDPLAIPEQPADPWAQRISAGGKAAKDILTSPGGMIGVATYGVVSAVQSLEPGVQVGGDMQSSQVGDMVAKRDVIRGGTTSSSEVRHDESKTQDGTIDSTNENRPIDNSRSLPE